MHCYHSYTNWFIYIYIYVCCKFEPDWNRIWKRNLFLKLEIFTFKETWPDYTGFSFVETDCCIIYHTLYLVILIIYLMLGIFMWRVSLSSASVANNKKKNLLNVFKENSIGISIVLYLRFQYRYLKRKSSITQSLMIIYFIYRVTWFVARINEQCLC